MNIALWTSSWKRSSIFNDAWCSICTCKIENILGSRIHKQNNQFIIYCSNKTTALHHSITES